MLLSFIQLLCEHCLLISHLCSPGSFPAPLSSEEEQECFTLMRRGDPDAKNKLVEHNLRLVAHVVKRYHGSSYETDDLISIGTIGLLKAISSFDSEKNTRFATYATTCINNELLMLMRSGKKHKNEVSIEDPIGYDKEGNEINLLNVLSCEEEDILDKVEISMQIRKLYRLLRRVLEDRERFVLCLRYGLRGNTEMTQREIAKKLGISRSYVSRIEKKALTKLASGFQNTEK